MPLPRLSSASASVPLVLLGLGLTLAPISGFAAHRSRGDVRVSSDFEGGSIGKIEVVDPTHLRCAVEGESDQNGRNRQANWYYFRLDNVQDRDVTIDLVNLPGEYNFVPNRGAVTKDTVPVFSTDNGAWTHFPATEYDAAEPLLRLHLHPTTRQVWIAHVPPYTNRHLKQRLEQIRKRPGVTIESAGETPKGRSIPLVTITDPNTPEAGKKVAWLMFRQHSWEAGSSWTGDGALEFLASEDPDAARLRRQIIWKILPMCDPDGVARGGVRFNRFGFDLNRNWDVDDPEHLPEITAERKAVLDWVDAGHRVDFFLTLHNTETGEYLEGPDLPLLPRLYGILKDTTTFAPTVPPRILSPSPAPGRHTAPENLFSRRKLPAFLMEQMIARNPKMGHFPNIEDRRKFGPELVRGIAAALLKG